MYTSKVYNMRVKTQSIIAQRRLATSKLNYTCK